MSEKELGGLLLALKMFLADGPDNHENPRGTEVFNCCYAESNGPHAEDCTWFNLLKAFERYHNRRVSPAPVGLEEILKDVVLWWENALNDRCEVTPNVPYCFISKGKSWKCASHIHLDEIKVKMREFADLPAQASVGDRDFTPEEALEEAHKRWGGINAVSIECYLSRWDEMPPGARKYKVSGIYKNQEFDGDSFRAAFAAADRAELEAGDKGNG